MPIDPTPEGGEVMHEPLEKPFPSSKPAGGDEGGHEARDEDNSKDALANRDLDAQTGTARPPLGN